MQFLKTIIFLFLAIAGSYAQAFYTSTQLEAMKSDIYLRPQKISGITTANYKHIRLNEVLPNLIAGTNISITGTYPNKTISATFPTISLIAGAGISISGSGSNYTITNTATCPYIPDGIVLSTPNRLLLAATCSDPFNCMATIVMADNTTLSGAIASLNKLKNDGHGVAANQNYYNPQFAVGQRQHYTLNGTTWLCDTATNGYFAVANTTASSAQFISANTIVHFVNGVITGIYPQ